ncbi:MAG: hypothetical protein ACRELY_14390 [Polyangiaceae bacterium]
MKTAISIPDAIFEEAESTARRLGMNRSELFSKAVAAFLEANRAGQVTEALNRVYGTKQAKLDTQLAEMQRRTIADDAW